jgi:hypothetical protein
MVSVTNLVDIWSGELFQHKFLQMKAGWGIRQFILADNSILEFDTFLDFQRDNLIRKKKLAFKSQFFILVIFLLYYLL